MSRLKLSPRPLAWWAELQDTLWFIPTVGTLLCSALALTLVNLDQHLGLATFAQKHAWLFGGGADGARGVLTAIAGSLVTVIGTVFSIQIVALQLASSQYTPRVLRQFTGDRVNQAVLAAFIGTFTYALLVLRSVRAADDESPAFVPILSVSTAILLALICVALLILFIHHSARSIQASVIIDRVKTETVRQVEQLFRTEPSESPAPIAMLPKGEPAVVETTGAGYLQHVDADNLCKLAEREGLTIRALQPVGAFLHRGATVADVWPRDRVDDQLAGKVRSAFVLGIERTIDYDVAFGIRQLADIALKALSPGINDPTTAMHAIDRLGEILILVGSRLPPSRFDTVDDRVAVILPTIRFADLVDLAFTQIRSYGASDVVVMAHLMDTLGRIAATVAEAERAILQHHAWRILARAREATDLGEDLVLIENAAGWFHGPEARLIAHADASPVT
ncbi:MAG: DUF2254 domain-containing protein [Chloroflexota bacterium]|nr:DUF2254 domain-containing protein [Chloroflexota bacterium]